MNRKVVVTTFEGMQARIDFPGGIPGTPLTRYDGGRLMQDPFGSRLLMWDHAGKLAEAIKELADESED